MIIKKFVGKTEEEAVEAAQKELGSGVVIMNVKTVERKGLKALFRSKQIEVTVALEEENDAPRALNREAVSKSVRKEELRPVKKLSQEPVREEEFSYDSMRGAEDRISIEKKLDSLESLLLSRFQQSEEQRDSSLKRADNAAQAEEIERQEESLPEEMTQQQRFLRLLYNTMLESEVDEKYANQIVNDVDMSGQSNLPIDYILENIYQKMILKFGRASGIAPRLRRRQQPEPCQPQQEPGR